MLNTNFLYLHRFSQNTYSMKNIYSVFLLSFSLLAFFISCNEAPVENKEEPAPVPVVPITKETKEKINYVINDVPSPIEVAIIIKEADLFFNTNLMNPLTNLSHYSGNNLKAFNLGVYGADLAYLVEYSQTQTALKYLAVCKQLAEEMGVTSAFDNSLISGFEKNISDKDSLLNLMYPAYKRVDEYLRSNERAYMASLVLAGGFVEGMYFATQLLLDVPRDEKNSLLFQKLEEQKKVITRLMELLKERKEDADFTKLGNSFNELLTIYNSIGQKEITQAEISKLNSVMVTIRNEFVLK